MTIVTCIAPVNIAVIKYWGKRDEKLILPINDSLSVTLDTDQLCAKTSVMISSCFEQDRIWLNGREEDIKNVRLQNCLAEMRKVGKIPEDEKLWKIHICSENNFPTAAGLASSAAGYACLAMALSKLYRVETDSSLIARIGSGSACRSTIGGFVRWYMGSQDSGEDSIAKQIVPVSHWPEMRILIIVVNQGKKKVPSTIGMRRSVESSELLKYRANHLVPKNIEKMQQSILNKDFQTFAELTMRDSNQMHAICLDSYPSYNYMNDVSHKIVDFIHSYNAAVGKIKIAYTFDAGPNATLFLLEDNVSEVTSLLDYFFPPPETSVNNYKRGIPVELDHQWSRDLLKNIDFEKQMPGQFEYIFHTRVGEGPKYLDKDHLLDNNGWPYNNKNSHN